MKNFVEKGETFRFLATKDYKSGDVVIVGDLVGVAVSDVKTDEEGVAHACGVYRLPKSAGAIGQGAKVYWVAADSNVSTTASGNTLIGRAWESRVAGDDSVNVKLTAKY